MTAYNCNPELKAMKSITQKYLIVYILPSLLLSSLPLTSSKYGNIIDTCWKIAEILAINLTIKLFINLKKCKKETHYCISQND